MADKTTRKLRLDLLLPERGLAPSRERARALVMAGQVRVDGQVVDRPSASIDPGASVSLDTAPPFVGRGGEKLAHALDAFGLDVAGLTALDVGASTGGFTDCLLQRGAARVYAVDAGHGQLDYSLRRDNRVVVMEKTNARNPFTLPGPANVATVDVSFISLTKVLPSIEEHVSPNGRLLCLVKPQFEAGRGLIPRGGVVRNPLVHGAVLAEVLLWCMEHGFRVYGVTPSPLLGDKGNREFFICLGKGRAQIHHLNGDEG